MKQTLPMVFLVGETRARLAGLKRFLLHIDAEDWDTDALSDPEGIIELMGRLCYASWKPGHNPNVTRVREGNEAYIKNIVKVKHGSVLEHASANFIFTGVSRVFTHELVRHRAGTAISQESLRFVRLSDLSAWIPTVIREDSNVMELFTRCFEDLEELQKELADLYGLDEDIPFSEKKKITSAMRRLAPIGLATNIGWTANMRTLRWVLEARTHPSAEEEIRLVFAQVGLSCQKNWPNLFADFETEEVDGILWFKTENSKV